MNVQSEKPYIDFYRKYKISPVAQDISNLEKHFERRKFLYRRLGIVGSFIKDKSIIEFGPGSGHNALYVHSLQPGRYVLVDGNPTGLKECGKLLSKHFPDIASCEFVESLIEEYPCKELFDLVICEGLIPGQKNPRQFLNTVARFTRPGGVCVITCQDIVGYFTDLLRCLMSEIVTEEGMSLEQKTEILLVVFEKHFIHLKGMSRLYKDWVLDNIMHRAFWVNNDGDLLSIESAIQSLDPAFDVYGVSPFFFTDWRWYKDVYGDNNRFNETGIDCYRKNLHNLLDYRYAHEPRAVKENVKFLKLCTQIWRLIAAFGREKRKAYIDEISEKMRELETIVGTFSPLTAQALSDFNNTLKKYPDITPKSDWGSFAALWGRGTQYLSFIRNDNTKIEVS